MAPNRLRATEDSRSESSNTTGRQLAGQGTNNTSAKGKRAGTGNVASTGSNLKDVTLVADATSGTSTEVASGGINWASFPPTTLSVYRHAHRLHTPACYRSLANQALLNHPKGLGRHAPSMTGRARSGTGINGANGSMSTSSGVGRRVPKEQLAMAVRKDFNAAAVNEAEVVTNFLYVVKNQDKKFRMRFSPGKK